MTDLDKNIDVNEEINVEEISDDISDIKAYDIPAIVVFIILFFIVVLQFFTRYILNNSLGWTEEIARYFLILLGFVGGIICVRKKSYIFLEFAYRYLPKKSIKPTMVFCDLIVLFFSLYCGWLAYDLAKVTQSNMVSIEISKSIIYYIVSISCYVTGVFAFLNTVKLIKNKDSLDV